MAAGVLERHGSVALDPRRARRAPHWPTTGRPLPPKTPVRAAPCALPPERRLPGRLPRSPTAHPEADRGGACSRRARALDRVRHALLASLRLSRGQNHYVDGRDALDLAEERRHRPAPAARARGAQTPAAGDDRPEEPREVWGQARARLREDTRA